MQSARGRSIRSLERTEPVKSLNVSAIAIGFLAGIVVPYAFAFGVASVMALATGERSGVLGIWFTFAWTAVAVGAPVLGGYVAARRAKAQPLLHGFAVGVLGTVAAVVFTQSMLTALWATLIWGAGGIVGGWLWRKGLRGRGAP